MALNGFGRALTMVKIIFLFDSGTTNLKFANFYDGFNTDLDTDIIDVENLENFFVFRQR